jgi:hypothetical protein
MSCEDVVKPCKMQGFFIIIIKMFIYIIAVFEIPLQKF